MLNPFYPKEFTPRTVIKRLIGVAGSILNKDVVKSLVSVVPIYPVGVYVKVLEIDDRSLLGHYGVVAEVSENNLSRPVIILVTDKQLKKVRPIRVDTAELKKVKFELML